MPFLDVSDILLDPDFVDTSLACTRNAQAVGDDGLAVDTPTVIPFSGVVTNNTGDLLVRMTEGSRIQGSITIHTRFRLQAGGPGRDADIVTWQGRRYTVSSVGDWSTYGAGFILANCDLIPLSG